MTPPNGLVLSASLLVGSGGTSFATHDPATADRPPVGPVQFSFVGEIVPAVLRDGMSTPFAATMPSTWAGGRISGVVSLDVDRAVAGPAGPGGFRYTHATQAGWIDVTVRNPDGSLFALSRAAGDAGAGTVELRTGVDPTGAAGATRPGVFRIERRHGGDGPSLPQTGFGLEVGSRIGAPTWARGAPRGSATDLAATQVDVEYANLTNAGTVHHRAGADGGYAYAFSFLSITNLAPFAEPGAWSALASGLGLVGWARRRP